MDGQNYEIKKRRFAAFDIDGTIARTSLLQLLTRELVARGKLPIAIGHEVDIRLHDYRQKIRDDNFGKYMADAVQILFENLKSLPVNEYLETAQAIVNRSVSNTYVYTRDLIENLKSHGYFLIAISGSEMRLVDLYTKALGFDASVGAIFYEGDTEITGKIQLLDHPKNEILSALVNKFNLDLRGSIGVGDTSSDVVMLEMTEQPIAFNPNQELFKTAREKGWMVVIERKDMVYGLEATDSGYILKTTNI